MDVAAARNLREPPVIVDGVDVQQPFLQIQRVVEFTFKCNKRMVVLQWIKKILIVNACHPLKSNLK